MKIKVFVTVDPEVNVPFRVYFEYKHALNSFEVVTCGYVIVALPVMDYVESSLSYVKHDD